LQFIPILAIRSSLTLKPVPGLGVAEGICLRGGYKYDSTSIRRYSTYILGFEAIIGQSKAMG